MNCPGTNCPSVDYDAHKHTFFVFLLPIYLFILARKMKRMWTDVRSKLADQIIVWRTSGFWRFLEFRRLVFGHPLYCKEGIKWSQIKKVPNFLIQDTTCRWWRRARTWRRWPTTKLNVIFIDHCLNIRLFKMPMQTRENKGRRVLIFWKRTFW